jgi:hypothetical protein
MSTSIPDTTLSVQDILDTLPLSAGEAVSINDADINVDFRRVSADLAYWGVLAAKANRAWRIEKLATKRLASVLAIQKRMYLENSGRGKVTISEVESAVETDQSYQEQQNRELEAEFVRDEVASLRDAIYAKKDMLISLGAQLRSERNYDPATNLQRSIIEAKAGL